MRRLAAAVWFAFLASVVASAQTLRIFHIDVEQADATLFVAPGGKTMLVDSGQDGSDDEIKAAMDNAGVTKIDFLVTTHYHSDHFGGIADLTGAPPDGFGVTVSKAFDRGDKDAFTQTEKDKPTMKGYLTAVGNSAEKLSPGDTIDLDQNMTVKCVASGRKVIGDLTASSSKSHENDSSVGLLIEFGEFAYFIGGDIEKACGSRKHCPRSQLTIVIERSRATANSQWRYVKCGQTSPTELTRARTNRPSQAARM